MTSICRRYLLLFIITLFFGGRSSGTQVNNNAGDHSSYIIAKQYIKNKNYLLAYKHLLIFKYSNLDLLKKPSNQASLAQLDQQIAQLEDYCTQNTNWISVKGARGFSDVQLDSVLKAQGKKIQLKEINLN